MVRFSTLRSQGDHLGETGTGHDTLPMAETVLIVDDHPGFRAAARRLLELEGYEVVGEAEDGLSAIAAARELRPDFILLDVQLPDVDGFEVAERLCVDPTAPQIVLDLQPGPQRLRFLPRDDPCARLRPQGRALGRGDRRYSGSVRLAIIGGGGFRVPLIYGAVLRAPSGSTRSSCTTSTRRGSIASRSCSRARRPRTASRSRSARRPTSTRRSRAPTSCSCAIRVGGLEGRTIDEGVPLGRGVLGQETIGPGGICFALRTIPAMVDLARSGRAGAERLDHQLHEPGRDGHRGAPAGGR